MSTYRITFTSKAAREFKKLPREAQRLLKSALDTVADNPRGPGTKKLINRDGWRVRKGNYRAIYEIIDDELVVNVVRVGHRRDVYRTAN